MVKKRDIKKRFLFLILLGLILLVVLLFGARIYLVFNALLGNDVIISVNSDEQNLFLNHSQEQEINVKADIIANPFCTVYCSYSFKEVDSDSLIQADSFTLKTIKPFSKKFTLKSPEKGEGLILYRFNFECYSKQTYLCDTTEELKSRTILVTLNYSLNEQETLAQTNSKKYLEEIIKNTDYMAKNTFNYEKVVYVVNNDKAAPYFVNSIVSLKSNIEKLNSSIKKSKDLWDNQDYFSLEKEIQGLSIYNKSLILFSDFILNADSNISSYNQNIERTFLIRQNLTNLSLVDKSQGFYNKLNKIVQDYNNLSTAFNSISLEQATIKITSIEKDLIDLEKGIQIISTENLSNSSIESNLSLEPILSFNKTKLILPLDNSSLDYRLEIAKPSCCLYGSCNCCNESCNNQLEKFPILFLHGHSFNEQISSEMILNTFKDIQKEFETYNYLDAGSLFVSNQPAYSWRSINSPVTVISSYYFDTVEESEKEINIESKKESIDIYALRLNDIVKELKQRTGKNKVILITHSMGGLVARRYIQIFGDSDIEKLIMITAPNKGIDGRTLKACPILGSERECSEMDKNSSFINKLNSNAFPSIPVYNIIGVGCEQEGEAGDGIVKNSSAYLEKAINIYINGSCSDLRLTYFHTEICESKKYPEIQKLLIKIIRNEYNK